MPYSELIPLLMEHTVGSFYMQMISEWVPAAALAVVAEHFAKVAFAKIATRVKGTHLVE